MCITLLNLGANMKAYGAGAHGGYPLHYAAKKGLDKTVTLLLSRGANPLAVNDDGQTPLDLARNRGHTIVVRLLEEELCLFSGMVREISGSGVLESLAPNLMTKKVWAVVLPRRSPRNGAPDYELAIYEPPKLSLWTGVHASSTHPAGLCNVANPRIVISLGNSKIEDPDFSLADPFLCITEKAHKIKIFSQRKGDRNQLKQLYRACKEMPEGQTQPSDLNGYMEDNGEGYEPGSFMQFHVSGVQSSQCQLSSVRQPILQSVSAPSSGRFADVRAENHSADSISEELALELALSESLRMANAEKSPALSDTLFTYLNKDQECSPSISACNSCKYKDTNRLKSRDGHGCRPSASQRWASSIASRFFTRSLRETCDFEVSNGPIANQPSAPPLGPAETHHSSRELGAKSGGTCVVCWDAPAEGACIPCGHLAGCMDCMVKVHSKGLGCPVCRCLIEQVIKVYTV
ncbi:hypothetical protein KP509_39G045500 [Ceratopteris richardii]|nr:hypothetical protein KP509_39G045500 [Ceratopteris richardii]